MRFRYLGNFLDQVIHALVPVADDADADDDEGILGNAVAGAKIAADRGVETLDIDTVGNAESFSRALCCRLYSVCS